MNLYFMSNIIQSVAPRLLVIQVKGPVSKETHDICVTYQLHILICSRNSRKFALFVYISIVKH